MKNRLPLYTPVLLNLVFKGVFVASTCFHDAFDCTVGVRNL